MEGRGYTRQKCLEIMANQASEEEYESLADHVLDNNGTVGELRSVLERLLGGGS